SRMRSEMRRHTVSESTFNANSEEPHQLAHMQSYRAHRRGQRSARRRLCIFVMAVAVVVSAMAALLVFPQPPTAHADPKNDRVLLIHGFAGENTSPGDSGGVPGGCDGTWNTVISYLHDKKGWTAGATDPHDLSGFETIGYYAGDARCTNNLANPVFSPPA